ncbi:hypothetical protein DXG01_002601 [Tephrocybe rancida]|nr:hypothetical protein DXG01_002601 [Tephrocybe rancida]
MALVLAYGFDGNKLEKYYLAGTTILSIVLNVPTMALGQFGWNESIVTCWYSNANDEVRLRWVIGTRSFWISLAATIEAVCSGRGTPRMFSFFIDGISPKRQIKSLKAAGTDVSNGPSQFSGTSVFTQDPRYRTVILRIDVVLYGLRTLAYGVLAAGDPSFINAVRKIRKSRGNRSAISGTVLTGISFASITAAPERSQSESNVKDGPDRKVEVFDVRLPETSSATTAWKDSVETGGAVAGAEIEREMEKFARQL